MPPAPAPRVPHIFVDDSSQEAVDYQTTTSFESTSPGSKEALHVQDVISDYLGVILGCLVGVCILSFLIPYLIHYCRKRRKRKLSERIRADALDRHNRYANVSMTHSSRSYTLGQHHRQVPPPGRLDSRTSYENPLYMLRPIPLPKRRDFNGFQRHSSSVSIRSELEKIVNFAREADVYQNSSESLGHIYESASIVDQSSNRSAHDGDSGTYVSILDSEFGTPQNVRRNVLSPVVETSFSNPV